jgi:large subunit ribosomal protein L9
MTELSKSVSKLVCVIKVKTGEDGKLFGTVTAGMIADELKHQFDITLDKRKIELEHAIKSLGEHEVALNLHHDVKATLKLRIESSTPIAAPAVEAKPEGVRSEKRSKPAAPAAEEKKPRAAKAKKAE